MKRFVLSLCIIKGVFLLHIVVSIRGIPQNLFVLSLCIVKGIFLVVQIGVCSISRRLKGHIFDRYHCYSVYSDGHFSWRAYPHIAASMMGISLKNSLSTCYIKGHISSRDNQRLPHIASSIRGIFSKRFIVTLCIVRAFFMESY